MREPNIRLLRQSGITEIVSIQTFTTVVQAVEAAAPVMIKHPRFLLPDTSHRLNPAAL